MSPVDDVTTPTSSPPGAGRRSDGSRRRLLVLGAGRHQVPLIERAEERGVETIAVDWSTDSPGKAVATHGELADALDVEAVLAIARRHDVDAVATVGTDQVMTSVAVVAERLGLPCHVSVDGAQTATNKVAMRRALEAAGVATTPGVEIAPGVDLDDVTALSDLVDEAGLGLPAVVKAADSQGQRAMSIVDELSSLGPAVARARAVSRTATVVVESFVEGPELTLDVWMRDGHPEVLVAVDRHTFNRPPAVGVCVRHVVPSVFAADRDHFLAIASGVASAYGMTDGPLYVQMLATADGYRVIEAAARVGGGHEAQLFEAMGGPRLLDLTIDLALGDRTATAATPAATMPEPDRFGDADGPAGLVRFVLADEGVVGSVGPIDDGVAWGRWYVGAGHVQGPVVDSLGRIGAYVVVADDRAEALAIDRRHHAALTVRGVDGSELVADPDPRWMNVFGSTF